MGDENRVGYGAFWGPGVLFIVVVGAYLPAISNGFVYDDKDVILQQKAPQSPGDFVRLFWQPHYQGLPYYRPVTRGTLLAQKSWHGNHAGLFHLVNALLIGLAALLAYALLNYSRLAVRRVPALLAAALFTLHPIASSCVYPIASGRETLLPALPILLAVFAFLHSGRWWFCLSLAAFAIALFSKEQAVILFPIFVLIDLLGLSEKRPAAESLLWWFKRYLPFIVVTLVYLGIRWVLFYGSEYEFAVVHAPWGPLVSYLYALQTVCTPFVTLVYEPTFVAWFSWPRLLASSALILLLVIATVGCYRQISPWPWFWLGWYFFCLLPTANLLKQEAFYAERYVFLASLSVFGLAAQVVSTVWHRPWLRRGLTSSAIFLTAICVLVSLCRVSTFRNEASFVRQWVQTNPTSAAAHYNMGVYLCGHRRLAAGEDHFIRALKYRVPYPEADNNLAICLSRRGRWEEAVAHCRRALETWPNYLQARINLGNIYLEQKKLDAAVEQYSKALAIDPRRTKVHYNLGRILIKQGQTQRAHNHFVQVVASRGPSVTSPISSEQVIQASAYLLLGQVLTEEGRPGDALAQFEQAWQLLPSWPPAANALAWGLATYEPADLRDGSRALQLARQTCVATAHRQPFYLVTLAAAYAEMGNFPLAIATAQQAIALTEGNRRLKRQIAAHLALYRQGRPCRQVPASATP